MGMRNDCAGAWLPYNPCPWVFASTLEDVGDVTVEQTDAEGGAALGHRAAVLLGPRHACDIQVSPGHIVDEALEELGADDAAGVAVAGNVLDVSGVGIDRLV